MELKVENANQALIASSHVLKEHGAWRHVRGLKCLEIPEPVLIQIDNPADRCISIKARRWPKFLGFVESLWIASGMNDLDKLPGRYIKSLYNYSDDGRTWRAGYGPRIRTYNGDIIDYDNTLPMQKSRFFQVDQLKYVIDSLRKDRATRQAIIEIGDPLKDCFEADQTLKQTKDYPCSRLLQFMVVDGKLNCTLYIRSNDLIFGMSGVNIFNFTWMQEYVSKILGIPLGKYYHFANNLHVYDNFVPDMEYYAGLNLKEYSSQTVQDHNGLLDYFTYSDYFLSLEQFDDHLETLYSFERLIVLDGMKELLPRERFKHDMFQDWATVFYRYKFPEEKLPFHSPYLTKIFD